MEIESKYGLHKIKDNDALLLLETIIENGSEIKEAVSDLKMLDSLIHAKEVHLVSLPYVKRTSKGNFRKGHTIWDVFDSVIEARLNGEFD